MNTISKKAQNAQAKRTVKHEEKQVAWTSKMSNPRGPPSVKREAVMRDNRCRYTDKERRYTFLLMTQ